MANQVTTGAVTEALVGVARVITLGGVAVIAHGHSRNTHDADIWMEPFANANEWSALLLRVLAGLPKTVALQIATWNAIKTDDLPAVIEEDGVIRIGGLERPLDIFRRPNELAAEGDPFAVDLLRVLPTS